MELNNGNIFFHEIYNLLNSTQNLNKNDDYNISHHKSNNGIVMYTIMIYNIHDDIHTYTF